MKVSFGQQTTKVKQLADQISQAISLHEFKAGDLLPSINQLAARYEVSRDTVFKAFVDLRERGLIDSTPGKGYYVTSRIKNVLLLLDEYSPFKDILYNSFTHKLSINYKVDLLFHQYNERLFNTILRESIGRYNKYLVMNFDNERLSTNLTKIDSEKLLLLDFGKFNKTGYYYLCQDFDEAFYHALQQLKDAFLKYKQAILMFRKNSKHPQSSKEYFIRFCEELGLPWKVAEESEEINIKKGDVYIAIRQQEVVDIIKKGRGAQLKCGKDFGLLAYNDIPSYEVIDEGITSLSIDWGLMGSKAAEFVLHNQQLREYLPTEVRRRSSL